MRKEIIEKIEIPEGIQVDIDGHEIVIKKDNSEVRRKFTGFTIKKVEREIILECKKATKNEKKLLKTIKAHINNMISGLGKKFIYKLQICAVHFPMAVTLDKNKKEVVIKNFLGEVRPRIAKVNNDVEVKIDKEIITVEGHNKELTGQTAANIETAARIRNRDRRTFQDGIFLIERPN